MVTTKKKSQKTHVPDFQKRKLKVGRLAPSTNTTSTSFRTTKIALPTQLLTSHIANEPLTKRGNTMVKCVAQCNHPNSQIRRDATEGVKELIEKGYELQKMQTFLGIMMKLACIDIDESVRKCANSTWKVLLEKIEYDTKLLNPFANVIQNYVSAALTHIKPDIRHGAIGVMKKFLAYNPSLLSTDHLIEDYGLMLDRTTPTEERIQVLANIIKAKYHITTSEDISLPVFLYQIPAFEPPTTHSLFISEMNLPSVQSSFALTDYFVKTINHMASDAFQPPVVDSAQLRIVQKSVECLSDLQWSGSELNRWRKLPDWNKVAYGKLGGL